MHLNDLIRPIKHKYEFDSFLANSNTTIILEAAPRILGFEK